MNGWILEAVGKKKSSEFSNTASCSLKTSMESLREIDVLPLEPPEHVVLMSVS